jgi:hypothetical protein
MSSAFIGGVQFQINDGASPEVVTTLPEVLSLSEVGQTNPLVDVSSFDSTAREYIGGLADGSEIAVECNYLPGDTTQEGLKTNVNNKTNTLIRLIVTDSSQSPVVVKTFDFSVIPLSWTLGPSFDDKNTMSFSLKITGAITET